ncbi:hypothetical protein [Streptomyces poriticola]
MESQGEPALGAAHGLDAPEWIWLNVSIVYGVSSAGSSRPPMSDA